MSNLWLIHSEAESMDGAPIIRLEGISKSFAELKANGDISLSLHQGRVLALLGENGAGKSTLMSILAGQLQPDEGVIYLHEKPLNISSTDKAIEAGIGMVYQHFTLVAAMSVAENIFLGHRAPLFHRRRTLEKRVRELAEAYAMDINPAARIADLSMGEKQQVEILKLLSRDADVLIFDEPTAVLTPLEVEGLFTTIGMLKKAGKAIVFISHKLDEVMAIADDIAVLRRGRIVDVRPALQVSSTAELASLMVGREVLLTVERQPMPTRQLLLRASGLSADVARNVDLQVRQGEIVAIVGVAGNGQKPLIEAICGLRRPDSGDLELFGKPWREFFSRYCQDNILSYISEDRQGLASCQELDLLDNFLLTTRFDFCSGPFLLKQRARRTISGLLEEFGVTPPDPQAQAWQLSGGNLQKMVLSREFYRKPLLIVAEQPTQGLDIGAIEEVWKLLLMAREQAGILLITSDLGEALSLADRVAVMYGGLVVDTFSRHDDYKVEQIPQMMAGLWPPKSDELTRMATA